MQVNITGETERMIQAALATGQYASAEEFIAAKLQEQRAINQLQSWSSIPRHVDIDTLAAQQGVGPIKNFQDLKASFWQDEEDIDAFVNEIRLLRDQDIPRVL